MRIVPILVAVWGITVVCPVGIVNAQPTPNHNDKTSPNGNNQISIDVVHQRMQQAEDSTELDDAAKTKAKELYQLAIQELETARDAIADWNRFSRDTNSATQDVRQAREQLDSIPQTPTEPAPGLSLAGLEELLDRQQGLLKDARKTLAFWQAEPNRRAARRRAIADLLKDGPGDLANIERDLKLPPDADEPADLELARHTVLLARRESLQRRLDAAASERSAYDATVDLMPLQRSLASVRLKRLEDEVEQLQRVVGGRQRTEIDNQLTLAEQAVADAPNSLRAVAETNLELARRRKSLHETSNTLTGERDESDAVLRGLREQTQRTKDQVDAVGLSNAIGLSLRKQRAALPDDRDFRRRSRLRQFTIRDVQQTLFELEERRKSLDDFDAGVDAEMSGRPLKLRATVEQLLKSRGELLDLLLVDYNAHFYDLVDLDTTQRQIISETQTYRRYIDERVLWIGSVTTLALTDLPHGADALFWLVDPRGWWETGQVFLSDRGNVPLLVATALLLLMLIFYHRRATRRLLEIGDRVAAPAFQQYLPTAEAALLTLITSAPLPALIALAGWRLSGALFPSAHAKAVGEGLIVVARFGFFLVMLRQTCRARGLAGAHFGWTATDLGRLRRWLRWLMTITLPPAFVAGVMDAQGNPLWQNSLGRVAFSLSLIFAACFLHRLLHPQRGILYEVIASRAGWAYRLRFLWYVFGAFAPLALAALDLLGYDYTARRLAGRLELTAWLLFGLLVVASLMLRWVLIYRRRLAMQQARERAEAARQEAAAEANADAAQTPSSQEADSLDLQTINVQTRRLLLSVVALGGLVGMWLIWVDVLPALGLLDQVELWDTTGTAVEKSTAPDGTVSQRTIEQRQPVTLVDVGVTCLILAMMIAAARNLPGLLELAVLRWLPIDMSLRYTITTVSRYLVIAIGIAIACQTLGVVWSKVQWLLAALTVGLGFGLQEIFANFVSGIILLLERPIRVGDLVTIGETHGTVQKIQMRATTVRDWDAKELVVPNKELVTGKVVNWTLTDSISRVVMRIGIAYGSDTELARALMLKVATDHPRIEASPKPKAIFKSFGENALELELRIWIPHLDYWPRVVTEINTGIDQAFRAAGIVIAFPQRDVHLRTVTDPPMVDRAAETAAEEDA